MGARKKRKKCNTCSLSYRENGKLFGCRLPRQIKFYGKTPFGCVDYSQFKPDDFIENIHGKYQYRVLGRDGWVTHHTDDYNDAVKWFNRCLESWAKDKL